jgi:ribonuclease E
MELSRQRLQPSLEETAHINCPRCSGTGFIRGTESTALHVLRIMQEEAMKENTGAVHAQVPVDVASFLLNEKRTEIQKLEARLKVNIVLVPNPHLETPHYKVQRLRHDELNQMDHVPASYEMVERPEEPKAPGAEDDARLERQQPVVKGITPQQPAPVMPEVQPLPQPTPAPAAVQVSPIAEAVPGFLSRLFGLFKAPPSPAAPAPSAVASTPASQAQQQRQQRDGRRDHGRGGRDRDRDRGARRDGRGVGRREERLQQGRLEGRRNGQGQGGPQQRDGQREGQRGDRRPERGPRPERGQQPQQQGRPQQQGGRPQHPGQGRPPQEPRQQPPAAPVAMEGEAPQFHQLAPDAQPRPERDGEEHRRGRRGRRGRGRGEDRPREGAPQAGDPAVIEAQRRIHELESRNESQVTEGVPPPPAAMLEPVRQEEPRRDEPPAFLMKQEEPKPERRTREEPKPELAAEIAKADPKKLLDDAGLVMIETDRNKAPAIQAYEPEPVRLGRPRRERPKALPQDEDLQQVETKR